MKKHICKFSNWDLGHCMKWVCFTKCILCLWTFVFGSTFYPLDRNLRVMSDRKYRRYRAIFFLQMTIWSFSYAHMKYQCYMLHSITSNAWENINCYVILRWYPIIHYDTNNFWRWHNISFKRKKLVRSMSNISVPCPFLSFSKTFKLNVVFCANWFIQLIFVA